MLVITEPTPVESPVAPVKYVTKEQEEILDRALRLIKTPGYYFSMTDWCSCLAHAVTKVVGREGDDAEGSPHHIGLVAQRALNLTAEDANKLFHPYHSWGPFREMYEQADSMAERIGVLELRLEHFKETGL